MRRQNTAETRNKIVLHLYVSHAHESQGDESHGWYCFQPAHPAPVVSRTRTMFALTSTVVL